MHGPLASKHCTLRSSQMPMRCTTVMITSTVNRRPPSANGRPSLFLHRALHASALFRVKLSILRRHAWSFFVCTRLSCSIRCLVCVSGPAKRAMQLRPSLTASKLLIVELEMASHG